ncbi:glycoside hydrolase family 36 protein [Vibrio sp. TRT 17S01]|uniref:glycoside hydrolase family 36 protein n=1 Tax=Vibrio sp. TRT 17S01 TaxID=3418505 RepID=UPI003CFB88BC
MSNIITLDNRHQVLVSNADLDVVSQQNELHFSYNGLSNDPVSGRYVLFQMPFNFESQARLLGDGFQMLAQTSGTADEPIDIGRCPDDSPSYRIYSANHPKRYYNYLVIEESAGYTLLGFTSCNRFAGYFDIVTSGKKRVLYACIDGENTHPQDWPSLALESVVILSGDSLSQLYQAFSALIANHHPPRPNVKRDSPLGWCSWYAYYAQVTEQNILDNVGKMRGDLEKLSYVLLDDGYQAYMGDWLTPSVKFEHGIKHLVEELKAQGKKPGIWLAPFIAQGESRVFKENPDWFVRHANGKFLKAEDVTYAGWRCTPWYILDTTNPEVQEHLTEVVRTMREEWGIELFKLDANYWGSLKGQRLLSGVTGVEAYRLGMEAIIEGAGEAMILGCNAPMWPSLGLVDAMRVSDDVERDERRFEQIAQETFYRSWQHRKIWQIDPDCATFVSLANQATERRYYEFHRDVLLACGGLLLSGDPLPDLTSFAKTSLNKLALRHKHTQESARFTSLGLNHAFLPLTERNDLHCVFNYGQAAREITLTSNYPVYWYDYWTGEKLNHEATQVIEISLEAGLSSRAVITAL